MSAVALVLLLDTLTLTLTELASLGTVLRVAGVALGLSGTLAAGRSGQPALLEPDLHQGHQGLQLLVAEQTEQAADVDKVDEAGVELLVGAQVPELHPVAVVDVGVAAQHLAVDVADVGTEV